MAKTKEPKAGKGKEPKAAKVKVKGRLLEKVTNLVVVLFGLSLLAERALGGGALG